MKRLISLALFLVMLFLLPLNTFLVSARDINQVVCNGTDYFVASDGTEFFINSDDEDKLYKVSADGDISLALDEHVILLVNNRDTAYLVVYRNDECKLIRFDAADCNFSEIYSFPDTVSNIAMRDEEILYTLNGAAYSLDLCSLTVSTMKESGVDTLYFDENDSLKYISETAYDNKPSNGLRKASSSRDAKSNASTYSPRLTAPATDNPYYTTLNVFHNSGYGMAPNVGNCTCYAFGRSYENLGTEPKLCHNNAGDWYSYNKNNGFYSYGSTPVLGAVSVWKSSDAGHVAVVEVINGDSVTTSESGWKSFYFKTVTRSASNSNFSASSYYSFQGFIYVLGTGSSTPTYANLGDDFYAVIQNKACGKPITQVNDKANITLATGNGSVRQKWHFIRQDDGAYAITSCYNKRALEMNNGTREVCTPISAHDRFWGGYYQQWYLIPYNGGYIFQSKHYTSEDWVMDLYGGNTNNGTVIQINHSNHNDAQTWSVQKVDVGSVYANLGDDFYAVVLTKDAFKPIAYDYQTDSFVRLQTGEHENNSAHQLWRFLRQSDGSYAVRTTQNGNCLEFHNGEIVKINDDEYEQNYPVSAHDGWWNGAYQKWWIYERDDGSYYFESWHYDSQGWYMTLKDNNSADGASVTMCNYTGQNDQAWVIYRQDEVQLKAPTLTVTAGTALTETNFSWNHVFGAKDFKVKIWKNNYDAATDPDYTATVTSTSSIQLPAGNYQACVVASNHWQSFTSTIKSFTVGTGTYSITYNYNGGAVATANPTSYSITSAAITLNNPTKTGYTFTGWTGSNGTTPQKTVTIAKGSTGNKTYTANWTPISYSVKFNGNGATSGSMNNQEFTYDVAQKLTANAFKRTYKVTFNYNGSGASSTTATATYTFANWNKKADGSSTSYTDQQSVKNLTSTNGTTVNLYAQWTSASVTLPSPTRAGYTFVGWYKEASCTTKVGNGGVSYTPTDVITLYAKWTKNSYTISYTLNGGTVSTTNPGTYNVDTASFTLNNPTKTGYTFTGWTGSNGTTPQKTVTIAKGSTGNKIYTANWTPITYSVKFNGNGATSGSMNNQSFTYDVAQNLTANEYQRKHSVTFNYNYSGSTNSTATATATFNGWATLPDGAKVYNDKQSVKNLTTSGTYNLYANWTLGTVTLPTPTRTGYTFAGWNTNADGSGVDYLPGESYTTEADVTLYAQWIANTPVINPTDGSGTVVDEDTHFIYGLPDRDIGSVSDLIVEGYLDVSAGYVEYEYSNDENVIGTGTKLKLYSEANELIETYTVVIFGDNDGDGYITMADATDAAYYDALLDSVYDYEDMSVANVRAMDVNADGMVDQRDISIVIYYASMLIDSIDRTGTGTVL